MRVSKQSLRIAACLSAALGGLLWTGCRDKRPPTGNVTGRVTFNSQPVTAGTIVFENPDKSWITGSDLDGDGRYRLTDVRAGEYVVSVQPPAVKMPSESDASIEEIKAGLATRNTSDPANIPRPVRATQSSTLKANVAEGDQELHFDLAKATGA